MNRIKRAVAKLKVQLAGYQAKLSMYNELFGTAKKIKVYHVDEMADLAEKIGQTSEQIKQLESTDGNS